VPRGRRLDLLAAVLPHPLGGQVPHATTLVKLTRHLAHAGEQPNGKLARLVEELETTIQRTGQLIGQARTPDWVVLD
jgi:hypothetical protein